MPLLLFLYACRLFVAMFLRWFYGLSFAFVFVSAVLHVGSNRFVVIKPGFYCVFSVFYIGFMACPSVPICLSIVFCEVLHWFYGLSFAFVFVCAAFYVGFKRFFLVKSLFCNVFAMF